MVYMFLNHSIDSDRKFLVKYPVLSHLLTVFTGRDKVLYPFSDWEIHGLRGTNILMKRDAFPKFLLS